VVKSIARLVLVLTLTGCAQVTETPSALEQFSLATSPELEPIVVPWLIAFQETSPNAILHLKTLAPATFADPSKVSGVDLMITAISPPEGWFATPLYRETISLIVSPDNLIESLPQTTVEDIFIGRVTSWANLGGDNLAIEPIIPLEGEASREIFRSNLLSEAQFTLNALLAPTQEYMLEMVAERPGGIGFLLSSLVTAKVHEVAIEDTVIGTETVNSQIPDLAIDILAIGREEPTGALREFLVWLQGSVLP
jgi:DNA-binding transcriptional LysR family regulator